MPTSIQEAREVILAIAVKCEFNWDAIYNELKQHKITPQELKQINIDAYKDYTTILDVEYPDEIRTQHKPPFILFIKRNEWEKARKGA